MGAQQSASSTKKSGQNGQAAATNNAKKKEAKQKNKQIKNEIEQQQQALKKIMSSVQMLIRQYYGFVTDPTKSPRHNASITLSQYPIWYYFSWPINLAYHNLTTNIPIESP